jgi:hypothetical protein
MGRVLMWEGVSALSTPSIPRRGHGGYRPTPVFNPPCCPPFEKGGTPFVLDGFTSMGAAARPTASKTIWHLRPPAKTESYIHPTIRPSAPKCNAQPIKVISNPMYASKGERSEAEVYDKWLVSTMLKRSDLSEGVRGKRYGPPQPP